MMMLWIRFNYIITLAEVLTSQTSVWVHKKCTEWRLCSRLEFNPLTQSHPQCTVTQSHLEQDETSKEGGFSPPRFSGSSGHLAERSSRWNHEKLIQIIWCIRFFGMAEASRWNLCPGLWQPRCNGRLRDSRKFWRGKFRYWRRCPQSRLWLGGSIKWHMGPGTVLKFCWGMAFW